MLDTYDTHNSDHPANQKELPTLTELTELEQSQEYNWELKQKLIKAKKQVKECIELSEQGTNLLLTNKLKNIRL